MDDIASTYIKMLLSEMAKSISKFSYSRIESYPNFRQQTYQGSKDLPIYKNLGNNVDVHIDSNDNKDKYFTLDHKNGDLLHMAFVTKNKANDDTPFDHDEQSIVDREKKTDKLPKGYATDFIYDRFMQRNVPLKSSEDQYPNGHKMWSRLIDKALNDGIHAYHYNDIDKKFTKITPDNKEEMIKNSFGDTDDYLHKHLIISKTKLDQQ